MRLAQAEQLSAPAADIQPVGVGGFETDPAEILGDQHPLPFKEERGARRKPVSDRIVKELLIRRGVFIEFCRHVYPPLAIFRRLDSTPLACTYRLPYFSDRRMTSDGRVRRGVISCVTDTVRVLLQEYVPIAGDEIAEDRRFRTIAR